MRSNRNVGFCPTLVGLCPRGLLSYGLLSYGLLSYTRINSANTFVRSHRAQVLSTLSIDRLYPLYFYCNIREFLTMQCCCCTRRCRRILPTGEVHGKVWWVQRDRINGISSVRQNGDRALRPSGPRLRRLYCGCIANAACSLQRSARRMRAQHHGSCTTQPQTVSTWCHLAFEGRLHLRPRQVSVLFTLVNTYKQSRPNSKPPTFCHSFI